MSDVAELARKVAAILIRETQLEDATPEDFDLDVDLVEEVGLDSMDLTTVVLVLQDEFKIQIPEDEYPNLTTVRKLANFVQKQLAG